MSSDRVKTEHELEMVMAEKNLRDLWDGTEHNDKHGRMVMLEKGD